MTSDRRFSTLGFKRQTPIGPHVADFVSFPLRLVVDIAPEEEEPQAQDARRAKLDWMRARDYRIVELTAQAIAKDAGAVCESILNFVGSD